jgi:hypothetical protein
MGMVNGMELNFTFSNWNTFCQTEREFCIRTDAVHEFGHALGFSHEQNRPDTPSTCADAPQGENGDILFGPWDLASVMNYCNPNWEGGGSLSATDIAGVRALYGTRQVANFGYDAGSWRVDKHVRLVGDVNDDGRDDVVGFGDAGVYVSLSTGSGYAAPQMFINDFGYDQGWRVEKHARMLADVNADGRTDIVAFGDAGVFVALSGSNLFYPWQFAVADFGYDSGWRVDRHPRMLADVNADGRPDIVGFGDAGVIVSLSTGGATFAPPQLWSSEFGYNSGWRVDRHPRLLADVNGDGRADIIGFGDAGVYLSLSAGGAFLPAQLVVGDFGYVAGSWRTDRHLRMVRDVNGDGFPDIVGFGDAGVYVSFATRSLPKNFFTGFAAPAFLVGDLGYNQGWRVDAHPRVLADVTGDGLPDIVGYGTNSVYVSAATGSGFAAPTTWALRYGFDDAATSAGTLPREFVRTVGDRNGDGIADLIGFAPDGLRATDLKTHIVPPPPPARKVNIGNVGVVSRALAGDKAP